MLCVWKKRRTFSKTSEFTLEEFLKNASRSRMTRCRIGKEVTGNERTFYTFTVLIQPHRNPDQAPRCFIVADFQCTVLSGHSSAVYPFFRLKANDLLSNRRDSLSLKSPAANVTPNTSLKPSSRAFLMILRSVYTPVLHADLSHAAETTGPVCLPVFL